MVRHLVYDVSEAEEFLGSLKFNKIHLLYNKGVDLDGRKTAMSLFLLGNEEVRVESDG